MKTTVFFYILSAGLILSACSSKETPKQVITQEETEKSGYETRDNPKTIDKTELEAISKKLGFKISNMDNISLYEEVCEWLNTPYKYGGSDKYGADCSGFVNVVYDNVYGKELERQTKKIYTDNCERIDKEDLEEGDLVFFQTSGNRNELPNYVGIYLKNDKFVSVSSSKGVIISDLKSKYYAKNWVSGGRVY